MPLCLYVHINLPGIVPHVLDAHVVDHDDDNVGCFGLLRLRLRLLGEREAGMCRKEEEGEGEEDEEERKEGPVVVLVMDVAAVVEAGRHDLCL